MKSIILIGGGGHCKACIDVIEQQRIYRIKGIVDATKPLGEKIAGYPVIGRDEDLPMLAKRYSHALITVGQIGLSAVRQKLYLLAKKQGFELPIVISPRAYVASEVEIGEGTIIMHDVLVNRSAFIGTNCIVNTKALIEHDATIGDHCHIATQAVINGGASIGSDCFVGSLAMVKQLAVVPTHSFIKACAVVT